MNYISYAYGQNHFECDRDLSVILSSYWTDFPNHKQALHEFGAYAGREVYEAVYHVDHDAWPILIAHDLDGRRVDRVLLSPAERMVLKELAKINRPPYEGGSWHHHYAMGYLIGDPGLYCILTITGQTAYAIHKYAPEYDDLKGKLLSGEAYGATWMTEVQGGSDLGANQTVAKQIGGTWRLTGDKYFASGAGLTDYAITTARIDGAKQGPKGLSLFLLPRLNTDGNLNFHVRRLKDKSATRAVPSGEVELQNSEAILVGNQAEGIYYTMENLTVSRLANAIGAMGIAKKAHLEVLERVLRRNTFGKPLVNHPLIRRDLTDLAVRMAGGLTLAFHAIDAFDKSWHERSPYSEAYNYARFLSHLAKNRTAEHSAQITAMAMELFGGLGFLEEYAIARWHREALITPIWEGPSNIQTLDFLETMKKYNAHETFLAQIVPLLKSAETEEGAKAVILLKDAFSQLEKMSFEEAQWYGKEILLRIADLTQVALLYRLAQLGFSRYEKLASLYFHRFVLHEEYSNSAMNDEDVWGGVADARTYYPSVT